MGENMSIEIPIDIVGLVEMVIGQTITLIGRVVLRLGLRGRYDLLVGVTFSGVHPLISLAFSGLN